MVILSEMQEAINDWLTLLQGPKEPYFTLHSDFADGWKYLFRLIPLVLVMICAVLTFSYLGLSTSNQEEILGAFSKNTIGQARYGIFIILMGGLFAAIYHFVAAWFDINIEIKQIFFTFLLLLLPWIPVVVMVRILGYVFSDYLLLPIFIVLFIYVIFPIAFMFQFSRGIQVVSGCSKTRCLASVLIPFVLIASLIVLISLRAPSLEESTTSGASRSVRIIATNYANKSKVDP